MLFTVTLETRGRHTVQGHRGKHQCQSGGGEEQGASLSQNLHRGFRGKDKAGQRKQCGTGSSE